MSIMSPMLRRIGIFLLIGLATCQAFAQPLDQQFDQQHELDPFIKFNRQVFQFNTEMDEVFFQPVAKGYRYVVPQPVQNSVTNVFNNLEQPTIIANDLLQGDLVNAMADSWRFFINSTFGILGLFDVAAKMNVPIPFHHNDFGLTMARWGIVRSNYLVLPFLGPSTARDAVGSMVNYYALSFWPYFNPKWQRYSALTLYYVNLRAYYLGFNNLMTLAALDPYIFQRNAFLQRREHLIEEMHAAIEAQHHALTDARDFLRPSHSWQTKQKG